MSNRSSIFARLAHAFSTPHNGVLGLVDDVLKIATEEDLLLKWHDGHCSITVINGDPEDRIDLPFRMSVFRAALARVAALCNEQTTEDVSPYGGTANLKWGDPPVGLHVVFVNTPAEQRLELLRSPIPSVQN